MSAIVRSQTPFIHREFLLEALTRMGESCQVFPNGDIKTSRLDYFGAQIFRYQSGRYVIFHDSDTRTREFLSTLQVYYEEAQREYLERLERERQELLERERAEQARLELERLERERQAFVQSQVEKITARAKADGYFIERKEVNGKIKLVLSRTV